MADASPPSRYNRPSALAFVGYAAAIVIVLWSFAGVGSFIDKVVFSPPWFADFLERAFPPKLEPKMLARLGWKMLETLQIALSGAVIGIILSVPVALLAARGLIAPNWINQIVRTALGFIRAVSDIAWAIVFVVAVGFGPFAGMPTIAIDTIGFCGPFFADYMEAADKGPSESLTAKGARKLGVFACATVLAAMLSFISTSLFATEKTVRSSTILGLVGAGASGSS